MLVALYWIKCYFWDQSYTASKWPLDELFRVCKESSESDFPKLIFGISNAWEKIVLQEFCEFDIFHTFRWIGLRQLFGCAIILTVITSSVVVCSKLSRTGTDQCDNSPGINNYVLQNNWVWSAQSKPMVPLSSRQNMVIANVGKLTFNLNPNRFDMGTRSS